MTSPTYDRTAAQRSHDLIASREFEQQVRGVLPTWTNDETDASDRLDFWVPGPFIEVKEKRQPLTARWQDRWPGMPERDLFIVDELSVRRALRHWPYVYFVLRDLPADRLFVASIAELISAERVRVNRKLKGKWILNLQNFRRLTRLEDLLEFCVNDMADMPWKKPYCLSAQEVSQI